MREQRARALSKIEALVLSATALAVLPLAYVLDPDSMSGEAQLATRRR